MVDGILDSRFIFNLYDSDEDVIKNREKALSRFDPKIKKYFTQLAAENLDCDFLFHRKCSEEISNVMGDIIRDGLAVNGGTLSETTTNCGSNINDLLCQISSTHEYKRIFRCCNFNGST